MPKFEYSNNFTRAAVSFPAHKFPHTSSVYYQCNVRLCINNGGCNQIECNGTNLQNNNNGGPRKKRFVRHDHNNNNIHKTMNNNSIARFADISPFKTTQAISTSSETLLPTLPLPGALSSPQQQQSMFKSATSDSGKQQQQNDANDMSFDVYSGLYVSDIDVGGKFFDCKVLLLYYHKFLINISFN